jgi:hypothetical protein
VSDHAGRSNHQARECLTYSAYCKSVQQQFDLEIFRMSELPTAEQLEKLTLRAIAAFAARCARRNSAIIRGIIDDEVIDSVLRFSERVASLPELDRRDAVAAPLAAIPVIDAMIQLRKSFKLAALSVERTTSVTGNIFSALGTLHLADLARRSMARAAYAASEIGEAADVLEEPAATAARDVARRDYEILRQEFGEHSEIVLGEPIDLADKWWRERGAL